MKTALITDVHANREALTAVLAHARAQGADRYAFLGDHVGYGGDPVWVLDRVMTHAAQGAVAVLGNHDLAVLQVSTPALHPEAAQVIAWTREQLRPDQLRFLEQLPYALQQGDTLYVHANAHAPAQWEYLRDSAAAAQSLRHTRCRFSFCGHVHEPGLYRQTSSGSVRGQPVAPGREIRLAAPDQWLALPGSAGQPRDGNPDACYAIFDATDSRLWFHRVAYDVQAAAARIREAGLPPALGQRLIDGR